MMQNIKYISHKLAISLIIKKFVSQAVKLKLNFVQEKCWTLNSRILQIQNKTKSYYWNSYNYIHSFSGPTRVSWYEELAVICESVILPSSIPRGCEQFMEDETSTKFDSASGITMIITNVINIIMTTNDVDWSVVTSCCLMTDN